MTQFEHLVYSWATENLVGSGYGIVAHSTGWRAPVTSREGTVRALTSFLPADLLSLGDSPLQAIELREHPLHGRVLVKKTYLGRDTSGRPGRYVAHIVEVGELTGADALEFGRSETVLADWPVDATPTRTLEPISGPGRSRRRPSEPPALLIAGLLDHLAERRPVVLMIDRHRDVAAELAGAFALLPAGLTRDLTWSTFSADPESLDTDLIVASVAESTVWPARDTARRYLGIDDDTNFDPPSGGSRSLAADLLDARAAGLEAPDDINAISEFRSWLASTNVLNREPANLTDREVQAVLVGGLRDKWLAIPGARERVARLENDRRVAAQQAAEREDLARQARARAEADRIAAAEAEAAQARRRAEAEEAERVAREERLRAEAVERSRAAAVERERKEAEAAAERERKEADAAEKQERKAAAATARKARRSAKAPPPAPRQLRSLLARLGRISRVLVILLAVDSILIAVFGLLLSFVLRR